MGQGDAEIAAMQSVVAALKDLDDDARGRVLEWTAKRFNVALTMGGRRPRAATGAANDGQAGVVGTEFQQFADLLDAANPTNDEDRALVGGYWFQVVTGNTTFTGQQVNDTLKDAGHGVTNITRRFDRLQERRPAQVRQVSKSGRSKQARKTYKLTTAGIAAVERLMSGEPATEVDEE